MAVHFKAMTLRNGELHIGETGRGVTDILSEISDHFPKKFTDFLHTRKLTSKINRSIPSIGDGTHLILVLFV